MALHGEIAVNGFPLGDWQAVCRRDGPGEKGASYIYDCVVNFKGERITFVTTHDFDDGALALMSKVIGFAMMTPISLL